MVLFGLGETTIILTVVLFAIWIIVLDARAGVRSISPSLVEMAHSFGANRWQAFTQIYVWAALPEILAGIRLGVIRAVKGVIIGQLLVSIVGFGELFELYVLALPDGAFLGGAPRPLRLRLPARRGARLAGAPGRLLRGEPRLNRRLTMQRRNAFDDLRLRCLPGHRRCRSAAATTLFPVHRVYCVGRNYAEHAIEMGHDPNKEPPFFFQKNPDNLVTVGQRFPLSRRRPRTCTTRSSWSWRCRRAARTSRSRRRSTTSSAMPSAST